MSIEISISSASEPNLMLTSLMVNERLGDLFNFDVEFESADTGIDLSGMLSTSMTLNLETTDGGFERYFNGIVCEAEQTGVEKIKDLSYAKYRVKLVPKPWLLGNVIDCRIFKDLSTVDIVKKVLQEVGYTDLEISLSASYPAREYCVQYRESGLNFINRLMQQEGIYYYFKHTSSTHTMVLADGVGSHSNAPGFADVPYLTVGDGGKGGKASVVEWSALRGVDGVKVSLTDYNPLTPKASLLSNATSDGNGASGVNIFDYPGTHQVTERGKHYAQMRGEAMSASRSRYAGATYALGVTIGGLFTLEDYPRSDLNVEYLVTATAMLMSTPGYASSGGGAEPTFRCRFEALESKLPWRTMPTAEKPVVIGLQTAVVTGNKNDGAADEDIVVDKYGRVQVNFHWNTPDKKDADNSCPVRVATMWAGKNWGSVSYPRVGQEVVVSFIEGDPDRPLIVGNVYNAVNMPPYELPKDKTISGIKSRSLLEEADHYNEISIDDKKDEELVRVHAQKDLVIESEEKHDLNIGKEMSTTVAHAMETSIGIHWAKKNDKGEFIQDEYEEYAAQIEEVILATKMKWAEKFSGAKWANALKANGVGIVKKIAIQRLGNVVPECLKGTHATNIVGVGGQSTNIIASGGQNTVIIAAAGQSTIIAVGNQDTSILHGKQELYVKKDQEVRIDGKRDVKIEKDDELTVDGEQKIEIKKAQEVKIGDKCEVTVGKNYHLKAATEIKLECGESSITMNKSGVIEIKGTTIKIEGSKKIKVTGTTGVAVSGKTVDLKADTNATMKGTQVTVQGTAKAALKGSMATVKGDGLAQVSAGLINIG